MAHQPPTFAADSEPGCWAPWSQVLAGLAAVAGRQSAVNLTEALVAAVVFELQHPSFGF